jgi:DNA polymerase-3 subunit beta
VEITSLTGSYRMRGMPADDYPELPLVQAGSPIRIAPEALAQGLRGTLFASSADESKQLLTGVHLSLRERAMEAAATDGHRLAIRSIPDALPADSGGQEEVFEVTVPNRSLREVERLLAGQSAEDPVTLFHDRGQVVFLCADRVVTSRSLDGSYPQYRQLVPDSFSHRIGLDRRAFLAALERVAVLADQHNNVVRLCTDPEPGHLRIVADAQDVGSGAESVPALVEGDPIEIAFNVRYVLDGLKAMACDRIQLRCNTPTSPAVLAPDEGEDPAFTYLVMPVQIRT